MAQRRGKTRDIGTVIVLMIITFGIYSLIWLWKAHQELVDEFRLTQAGRKTGKVWFWVGLLVVSPLLLLYEWIFVSNVTHVRNKFGIRGINPGHYMGLVLLPAVFGLALQIWIQLRRASAFVDDMGRPTSLFWTMILALLALLVLSLVLRMIAVSKLQRDLNAIWHVRARWPAASAHVPPVAATPMRTVRCPRCANTVRVPVGVRPSCQACGLRA